MFSDPSSRLYWPLLLSSAIIAYIFIKRRDSQFNMWRAVKYYVTHQSTRVDVSLLLINLLLKAFVFTLIIGSATTFALPMIQFLTTYGAPKIHLGYSNTTLRVILTLYVFILADFLRFLQHKIMHAYAWPLHKVHHSAPILTPLTLFRTHPLEAFVSFIRSTLTHALTIVFMVYVLSGQLGGLDFLGVNVFGFIFNAALANLRHSPIPISFGLLEYLFISPRMHQIHHSNKPQHYNKNFGVGLSLWDQLSGSFYRPCEDDIKTMTFGISETVPRRQSGYKPELSFSLERYS